VIRIAIASAFLIVSAGGAGAFEWQAGYDLNSNVAGLAHAIAGEASFKWLEPGLAIGYGAKPFHEQVIDQSQGPGARILVKLRDADAFRVDLPVRLKFGKWPYLFGALGYERILGISGIEKTDSGSFSKANDLSYHFGAGYALWFGNLGMRLEAAHWSVFTASDKTGYYRDPSALPTDHVVFDTERFASRICWRASLRYRFLAPGK
jgi:hypothetical protein